MSRSETRPVGSGPRSAVAAALRERAVGMAAALTAIRRFRGELAPHRRPLAGASLYALAYTATTLAEPWPLKFIFDNVLAGKPLETPIPWFNRVVGDDRMRLLWVASGAILVLALLRGLFYYQQNVLATRVGQEVVMGLRRRLFAHLQRLPLSFHRRSSTGDLLTRLTSDINVMRDLLVASLLSFVADGIVLVGFLGVLFWMNWRLALMALVVVPAIFVLVTVYSGRIRKAARQQRKREGEVASRLQQVLSGIHVVQIFAREPVEDERLRKMNRRSLRSGLKTARLEAQMNRSVELAIAGATAAAIGFGSTEVIAGRLTPGDLIVFVAYMQSFYRPLRRISRVTERASKASACADRVTSILDQPSEVMDGPRLAPRFSGEIRLEGVDFGYGSDRPVLASVDLAVSPGQTVALVGQSGAGKSTLLGLIPRLYDPLRGAVLIDGEDVRGFTLRSLREQIAVVPQDGMLFGGDFAENIAYGKPDATVEEIEAAARAARLHDFIADLPDGYATPIAERGVSLSGGQRQRLAIARAIVKDAPIVLLDEPTTGLDVEAEGLVLEALDQLLAGRTAIVIAHRYETIRRADLIVVLEGGRLVEQGTHDALMVLGGRYRDLYELQFAVAAPAGDPVGVGS